MLLPSVDIFSLYNLTTFYVFAEVYSQIFVLSSNLGGGTECWVKWRVQNFPEFGFGCFLTWEGGIKKSGLRCNPLLSPSIPKAILASILHCLLLSPWLFLVIQQPVLLPVRALALVKRFCAHCFCQC